MSRKSVGGSVGGERVCVGGKYLCWGNPEMSLSDSQVRALKARVSERSRASGIAH